MCINKKYEIQEKYKIKIKRPRPVFNPDHLVLIIFHLCFSTCVFKKIIKSKTFKVAVK